MSNYQGATRIAEETTDEYTKMGQRLTAESARRLKGKCVCCSTTEGTMFLLHLSVMSDGIVSFMACEKCTKENTAFELFAFVIEKTIEGVERKRSALQ